MVSPCLVYRFLLVLGVMLVDSVLAPTNATAASLEQTVATAPAGAAVGVAVLDQHSRTWLYRHAAERPLRLASVTKIPVVATALLDLGPDYQFTTKIAAIGPISDGLANELIVIGGGSPCLDEHFTDGDPDRVLRTWAAELQAAGIRGSRGDLIIDSSLFDQTWRPATYPDDQRNAQQWYSAPASGFAFNDNCIDLQVVPTAPGQAARVQTRPHSPRITITNKTRSVSGKGDGKLNVYRHHHSNTLVVSGRYAKPSAWFTLSIRDDPDLLAGDHIDHMWRQQGITVGGTVRRGTAPTDARIVVEHHDPLLPALRILNQRSHNFYGEQIIRVMGARHAGLGSTSNGTAAVHQMLNTQFHIRHGIRLLDGSGLSYDNLGSPEAICLVLDRMLTHSLADDFLSTFKVHTINGVQVLAKTGTLAVARCLAGYIPRGDGTYVSFAILLNRANSGSIGWASKLRGQIAAAIVSTVKVGNR